MDFSDDSSPLTRGRLNVLNDLIGFARFIPSHEGQTEHVYYSPVKFTIHPLLRRADVVNGVHTYIGYDSSPLTRGRPGVLMYRV